MSVLPPELWRDILQLATDDAPLLDPSLISSFDVSCWFDMILIGWSLREPKDFRQILQRHCYALMKVSTSPRPVVN